MAAVNAALLPIIALSQDTLFSAVDRKKRLTRVLQLPKGAKRPRLALPAGGVPAVAAGGEDSVSPVPGIACLTYCTELHDRAAKPTTLMLRDSYTTGFLVETADGTIEIPPGTITLWPALEEKPLRRNSSLPDCCRWISASSLSTRPVSASSRHQPRLL